MRMARAVLLLALLPVGCRCGRALQLADASVPADSGADVGPPDAGRPDGGADADAAPDSAPKGGDAASDHGSDDRPDAADVGDASEAGALADLRSYRVRLLPAPLPNGGQVPEQVLTLSLIPESGATPAFIFVSVPGAAVRAEATHVGEGAYAIRAPLVLPDPMVTDPCVPARYVFGGVDVTLDANTLSGQARGKYEVDEGDAVASSPFTATLAGIRETEAPTIAFAGFDAQTVEGGVSPLGPLRFVASRPLQPGAAAALAGSDGSMKPLAPDTSVPGAVIGFSTDDGALTKLGATFDLVVTPALVDLAGNVGQPSVRVLTAPDPGTLAFDGFEGPVAAWSNGKLVFTDALDLPPITGQRSIVLVPAGSRDAIVVMRAKVPDAKASLRLRFRGEAETPGAGTGTLQVSVASPGGSRAAGSFPAWTPGGASHVVSTSRGPKELGPLNDVVLALPADATGEVFIELRLPLVCAFPGLEPSPILVDDVRIE